MYRKSFYILTTALTLSLSATAFSAQNAATKPAAASVKSSGAPASAAAVNSSGAATTTAATQPVVPDPSGEPAAATVSPDPLEPKVIAWPFNGPMGHLDQRAAQRGFQVYKQVCSACHSMNLVNYRSLSALGFSEAEIKALAAEKQVPDLDDKGQPIQRPGTPSDHLVPPYPNENASRAANNGAYPPDLSLIVKARGHGPDYVYSILTGFGQTPAAGDTPVPNKYYNPYFPTHWISMPPPLSDNVVTYQDGTPATVDQMARDVVTYLQWAAEPEMQQRHELGIKVMAYLVIMAGFLYVAKKRVWRKIGH